MKPCFPDRTPGKTKEQLKAEMRELISYIIDAAVDVSQVPRATITSDRRDKDLVWLRHAICVVARRHNCTYPQIARVLNRDHTSVMHAINAADDPKRAETLRPFIEAIESRLSGELYARVLVQFGVKKVACEIAPLVRPRVAPFPPGADKMILAGYPTTAVLNAFRHTGWIAP